MIVTAEKMWHGIKVCFKMRKEQGKTGIYRHGEKKDKAGGRSKRQRRAEDNVRIHRRRTSFPGSVSVTDKRSVLCCSHIQVLM